MKKIKVYAALAAVIMAVSGCGSDESAKSAGNSDTAETSQTEAQSEDTSAEEDDVTTEETDVSGNSADDDEAPETAQTEVAAASEEETSATSETEPEPEPEEELVIEDVTICGEVYQTDVTELILSLKSISAQDLENIAKCRNLVKLDMSESYVEDDSPDPFTAVKSITGKMEFLKNMKHLETVYLPVRCDFSCVEGLTGLKGLGCSSMEMAIYNIRLDCIKDMTGLKLLSLSGVNMIGDISVLKDFTELETLALYGGYCEAYESDSDIETITSLKSLKHFYAGNISEEGKQKILAALPDCVVESDIFYSTDH